ncbi:agenet domain containing protein [Musa troglodytarum]|uniref:Agenet domain containing protein n=1 Tax=Musa troglodytarum TaxID=320322 RepID=A0A9E7HEI1_9LILI|nr:agenet domain containing protein [Musa troglodytarum]
MEGAKGAYVAWQEVVVSNDKGRRVVHYYLKGAGGGADLAVVGREKSLRHMSYGVPSQFVRSLKARPHLLPSLPSSSTPHLPSASAFPFKWRSRREVIDWLSSLVQEPIAYESPTTVIRYGDGEDGETADLPNFKQVSSSGKAGHVSKEFSWLGASWLCRKRRKHYRSFCKNGVTISVYDFVFVMAEENKRLVAYVEDLYEDSRANNMVVVRWFHKVDEVGIVLPPNTSDREIFFSLCLQDLSVECIDGLAAVLSAQHFDKFLNQARYSNWRPYMCHRQIDNDDVKPFDITQLQGYWSQELLRSMFTSPLKLRLKITRGGSDISGGKNGDVSIDGSKRKHLLNDGGICVAETTTRDKIKSRSLPVSSKTGKNITSTRSDSLTSKELYLQKLQQQLYPGCHVEVLSLDSGMRGCWFQCVIIRRHQDKVKVRYLDIQDADESGNLQEWVLLSRVAAPDKLGIRLCGRPVVRPYRSQRVKKCSFNVGAAVDAWWHDGWWEGIVIRKESEGQIHVYFPGEKRTNVFSEGDLRQSQDWIDNKWNSIQDQMDIANSLLSDVMNDSKDLSNDHGPFLLKTLVTEDRQWKEPHDSISPSDTDQDEITPSGGYTSTDGEGDIPDLTKDPQFKWNSLKKKKRRRELTEDSSSHKKQRREASNSSSQDLEDSDACGGFVLPKSLTVDHENCKIGGDPMFNAPMTLSNLVMSQ